MAGGRFPLLNLRQIRFFKAQGKTQIETVVKKNSVTAIDETIQTATVDSFSPELGTVIASQPYEVSIPSLTAERDRLLADAQELTDFIATVPKLP